MTTPIVMLVGPGRSGKDTAGAAIARALGGVCVALADPIKRFCAHSHGLRLSRAQLWGDAKEAEFDVGWRPSGEEMCIALSQALSGWKTPAELSVLSFMKWMNELPQKTTPRRIMQTLGTECIRKIWPNFWIDHGLWVAEKLLAGRLDYDKEQGFAPAMKNANVVCFTDGRFRNEVNGVLRVGGLSLEVWRPEGTQAGFSEQARLHASETEQNSIPRWWHTARLENDGTLEAFESEAVTLARMLLGAYP